MGASAVHLLEGRHCRVERVHAYACLLACVWMLRRRGLLPIRRVEQRQWPGSSLGLWHAPHIQWGLVTLEERKLCQEPDQCTCTCPCTCTGGVCTKHVSRTKCPHSVPSVSTGLGAQVHPGQDATMLPCFDGMARHGIVQGRSEALILPPCHAVQCNQRVQPARPTCRGRGGEGWLHGTGVRAGLSSIGASANKQRTLRPQPSTHSNK